ncbi:hypothetical protein TESG_08361 [Trichophyton tonsurans CBS 112818]|uniref:Uncharacterized protein n=1 Tax=Trichophyton tonsurans (strain CBS 112818) TaxID=647933 RepID=F2RUG6_TRIT1|nr:hypothetical protein TESG_08361 [Trichophyton tonsurans CBS 112818]
MEKAMVPSCSGVGKEELADEGEDDKNMPSSRYDKAKGAKVLGVRVDWVKLRKKLTSRSDSQRIVFWQGSVNIMLRFLERYYRQVWELRTMVTPIENYLSISILVPMKKSLNQRSCKRLWRLATTGIRRQGPSLHKTPDVEANT